jgi:Type IV secretion system pilin
MRMEIMKKAAAAVQALALTVGLASAGVAGVAVSAAPASAACNTNVATTINEGALCSQGQSQKSTLFGAGGIFTVIANTLIFIIGAISVIYIIIGGLRYVTSGGDSKAVTTAKDTILYAVIGVVVAVISFALINFVVGSIGKAS